jgi:hypothetical protein
MIAKRVIREADAPSSFRRLAEYIIEDSARTADVKITNCNRAEAADAIEEIMAVQAMNARAEGDKTYHLVVSFPQGEHPSAGQLADIEDELCAAIGLAGHQRLSARHLDTDHLHLHVAINKVHPQSYRFVEPFYDKRKLMKACTRLEIQHGLIRTPHSAAERERLPDRVRDMEAHAKTASFLTWIKENAGGTLRQAAVNGPGWQALHVALAAFDLEIRPRGSGLIIAQREGSVEKVLAVKASNVDRALSIHRLTKRWGAFQPDDRSLAITPPAQRYAKEQLNAAGKDLYANYLQQRAAAETTRTAAQTELRARHERDRAGLREWYKKSREAIKSRRGIRGGVKRDACRELHDQRAADFAAQKRDAKADFAALWHDHPLPTWLSSLQEAADRGDQPALEVLRQRQQRQKQATDDLLRAGNPAQARHVVFDQLRPHTRRNGAVVYRVKDGGLVVDEADAIRVEELTAHAAFLALSLATERFADQALIVEGSGDFKRQIAEMAGSKQLDLQFADPVIEAERQRHASTAAQTPRTPDALETFIAGRNALRDKIPSILRHRIWTPADAGKAAFEGRRHLSDGSEAALLKQGDEMLVMALTPAQAAKADFWPRGQEVAVDANGRFNTQQRRGR